MYYLLQYNKFEPSPATATPLKGKIIMKDRTANGFIEKIMKLGFDKYVYRVEYTKRHSVGISIQIGEFAVIRDKIKFNQIVAEKSKGLIDFLKIMETSEKAFESQRMIEEKFVTNS